MGCGQPMKALYALLPTLLIVLLALPAAAAEVLHLRLDDMIHVASQSFVERALAEAAAGDVELVVLELDTPGGYVDVTRDMTSAITTSAVPVAIYVAPAGARAASAGFFLLICSDIAAMAPGTNTGAAHPVLMPIIPSSESAPSEVEITKATNDVGAMIRALAEVRQRNPDLALQAVTESRSFTAGEALEQGLIEYVASSLEQLLEQLDGQEIRRFNGDTVVLDLTECTITKFQLTGREKFKSLLAQPLVSFILMALAAFGIYTEITHPGGIIPGVGGLLALLLFLYSTSMLSINWSGLVLILISLALFALEVKVTSYGLLTLGGLVCFVSGAMVLFDAPIPEMRLTLGMVLPAAIVIAAVTMFLVSRVLRAHQQPPATGSEGLIGEIGRALDNIDPEGKVMVDGDYWDARWTGSAISADSKVRVVAVRGRILDVAPVQIETESASSEADGG